jgi:hypothetical protein
MFGSSIDFLTHRAKDITQTNHRSIKRIVAGDNAQELAAMDRKTGTLGRVIRISADNMSKQDSIRFFQNAMSFMKFQEETIEYARQLYSQMHALAQEAQSETISDDERKILSEKFSELRDFAIDLNNITFNGKKLFDQYAGSIKYDVDVGDYVKGSHLAKGVFYTDNTFTTTEYKDESVDQDFVYNSGILVFDIGPGGGSDHFKLSQDDGGGNENILFEIRWNTGGGMSTGDFDRFMIEWGPDQETTFRFIPLKEGSASKDGWMGRGDIDFTDPYYDNRARYIKNFNGSEIDEYSKLVGSPFEHGNYTPYGDTVGRVISRTDVPDEEKEWWGNWGLENYQDDSFYQNYSHLEKQNADGISSESPENYTDAEKKLRSQNVILDTSAPTTIPLTGFVGKNIDGTDSGIFVTTGKLDPLNTKVNFAHLPTQFTRSSQVRYKFFLPETDNTDVGNVGDLPTLMKPLGLGLMRDSEDSSFPILNLDSSDNAKTAVTNMVKELDGLTEQMGILGNNMARVLTSMDAVDKQLGIQRDLIAVEPEQVVLEELENLTYAREMRSFNASLMNKVVQINHDMIDLLLQ